MRKAALMLAAVVLGANPDGSAAADPPDAAYVVQNVRRPHPRLFINDETLARVRRDGLTPDQQAWLSALRKRVDGYPAPPPLDKAVLGDGKGSTPLKPAAPYADDGPWGGYAAHTALVYLLTAEKRYLDQAVRFLQRAVDVYALIAAQKRIPREKAFGRLWALSAYDWLFNDLSPDQRSAIGKPLFTSLHSFHHYWRSRGALGVGITYQDEILGWYVGLVFLRSDKIGGPGREFWAGGRNWPVREDWQKYTPDQHLFGCWRMEIAAPREQQRELFLHLIQVGDRQGMKEMTPSRLFENGGQTGVAFQAGRFAVAVLFNRQGPLGGRITMTEGAQTVADRPLAEQVQEQTGFALKPADNP